ncbi:TPA: hypothetical protein O8L60_004591 [Enterobacter cloacae]|nr:hypothetical protein [Enterobacter cloacae]
MEIIKNIKRLSVIALLVAGSAGVAHAAPVSAVVTGTGDVVFQETGTATITVTPEANLTAGLHNNTLIARATATATGGQVAYRWTPAASVAIGTDNTQRTISGKANAANKLNVVSTAAATVSAAYPEWYAANSNASTLDITVRTTPVQQAVAADTYVVSMDAAVWAE